MYLAATVVLGLGAMGGLFLLRLRLRGGNPPLPFAAAHGVFVGSGLVLLLLHVLTTGDRGVALVALTILAGAAMVGFWMLLRHHLKGKLIPLDLIWLHGFIVLTGYAILLSRWLS